MGGSISSCRNRPVWTFSIDIDVPVSADSLWSIVTDLEALPTIVPSVISFERAKFEGLRDDDQGKCQLGTRFRETRVFNGRSVFLTKTVTSLNDDESDSRHLSFGIVFSDSKNGKTFNTENTSTLTVVPMTDDTSQLLLTISATSGGIQNLCADYCCRSRTQKTIEDSMEDEVKGYRREAIRRYKKALQKEIK
mmetsp:Transcript_28139/g.42578  ORF Transcript_28139/g.42578 Transcript_28139/m.42578 type:complete len:193 (-) Transcript_28139:3580-4158(-)|eukprot:CAMPEP_0178897298 /NCGR_PEP_ID=MMETSP0786-20121207/1665_1 /TAXON_ID=186022 /ORGANISM="Thalassionema frauenfeldii, Strain CCMP 1798" /LENGTH=192 /DNA_ID=CAMNT_0020567825 /DNA_START=120 /DNA_END=698 /DNA_ORIENTATION=-